MTINYMQQHGWLSLTWYKKQPYSKDYIHDYLYQAPKNTTHLTDKKKIPTEKWTMEQTQNSNDQ